MRRELAKESFPLPPVVRKIMIKIGKHCPEREGGYVCMRRVGHTGRHMAHDGDQVFRVWGQRHERKTDAVSD